MLDISKEAYEKCEIETIDKGHYFWVSRRDLQIELGSRNWEMIFDRCNQNKQKYRYELIPGIEF